MVSSTTCRVNHVCASSKDSARSWLASAAFAPVLGSSEEAPKNQKCCSYFYSGRQTKLLASPDACLILKVAFSGCWCRLHARRCLRRGSALCFDYYCATVRSRGGQSHG